MTETSGAMMTVKNRKLRSSSVRVDGCNGAGGGCTAGCGRPGEPGRRRRGRLNRWSTAIVAESTGVGNCGWDVRVTPRAYRVGAHPSRTNRLTRLARSVCRNYRLVDYDVPYKSM